ncbi:hypothetical protein HS125_07815 [bacterium]|nr:hypothetical protein [bacterium]
MRDTGRSRTAGGHANPRWFIALVVVVVVLGVLFYFRRAQPIGTIGILGNPPESAEPLLARDGLSTGDTQKILRFSDGRELIAETGGVLDLKRYPKGRLELRRGAAFLSSGAAERALEVAAPHLAFRLEKGRVNLAVGDATTTLDVFSGSVVLADGRAVAPGLSVHADAATQVPAVRGHGEKIGWIGRLLSDPGRVRPDVEDTNLPGRISGMVVEADSWKPVAGAMVRALPNTGEFAPPAPVATDAAGRFHPERPDDGRLIARKDNLYSLGAHDDGHPTVDYPPIGPCHPLLMLKPITPYRIIITDERDKPLTGTTVRIRGDGAIAEEERTVEMGERTELEITAWRDYPVRIQVTKDGFHPGTAGFQDADPDHQGDVQTVKLRRLAPEGEKLESGPFPPVMRF